MSKTAFLFPGQGAQKCGMARSFYETDPDAKAVIDRASELLGMDMPELLFTPNDRLDRTEFTQPAMVTAGIAMLQAVAKTGLKADVCAGLSLGEYAAVVASGAMSMEDAFKVVRKRGIYMQEAVPTGGAMNAVIGLDPEVIEAVCEEVQAAGEDAGDSDFPEDLPYVVSVANYNNPKQTVITGRKDAVEKAAAALAEKGALKCVPLNVSGPFHSKLLEGAGEKLSEALAEVEIQDIAIPLSPRFFIRSLYADN